ncbi:MAG: hypothetical protein JSW50_01660 [Candidatus Latescibacterota bacterium]|nr:MAG: hypothetical protein JSW50_01660 [Candidatus Latescibacterota bacterium]
MFEQKNAFSAAALWMVAVTLLAFVWTGCSDDDPSEPNNPATLVVSEDIVALTSPNTSENLSIWNGGQGTLEWNAVSNQTWCDIAPTSGTSKGADDNTTMTVTVDFSGFEAGDTELAEVNVTSNGGNRTIRVTATLPQGPCVIDATHPITDDVWSEGIPQVIRWTSENTGGSVRIELYKDGQHQCQITPSTDDIGVYEWEVDDCGGGTASDYQVRIFESGYAGCWAGTGQFTITSTQPDPVVAVDPKALGFNSNTDPGPNTFEIWNGGTGTLEWSASVSTTYGWLSVAPQFGSSTGERDQVTVTIDWDKFNPAGEVKNGEIVISSNGGGGVITVEATRE